MEIEDYKIQAKFTEHQFSFNNVLSIVNVQDKSNKFIIRGELSGIQDFIFHIPSKGAAKYLKGRSVYLQILPEAIARFVFSFFATAKVNSFEETVVFLGGGNFMLELPTTENLEEVIKICHRYIEDILFKYHNGRIYLALAGVSTNEKNYQEKLNWQLQQNKRKRFISIPETFERFTLLERQPSKENNVSESGFYESFSELTNQNGVIAINAVDRNSLSWKNVFYDLSYSFIPKKNIDYIIQNDINSFDHLAIMANGAKKLAILKLDVDDLGKLFTGKNADGIKKLSGALGFFFGLFLDYLLNQPNNVLGEDISLTDDDGQPVVYYKGSKLIYVVYSGGDDCFLIGPWDIIVKLASEVNRLFNDFTNGKTLSSSVILIDESFPVVRAAALANKQLEKAKLNGKDSICIFNNVFNWEEWEYIMAIKKLLENIIEDTPGSFKSIIRKVESTTMPFAKILDSASNDNLKLQSISRLMYYLRNFKSGKYELAEIYQGIISKAVLSPRLFKTYNGLKEIQNVNYMIIPISCRLTELSFRTTNN